MTETRDDIILKEAASWHEKIAAGDADMADLDALSDWLEASPAHRAAYNALDLMQQDLMTVSDDASPPNQAENTDDAASNVIAFPVKRRRMLAAVASIAAVLLLTVWGLPEIRQPGPENAVVEYAAGEDLRRTVKLEDGSVVELNQGSLIRVAMDASERRVKLVQGEAIFSVTKAPERPFLVDAGSSKIRVVGTEFNVLRLEGGTEVTVTEGIVEVRPVTEQTEPIRPAAHTLTAGQQLRHSTASRETVVAEVDPRQVTAWREGILIYDNTPLSEVFADLERYMDLPIEVELDVTGLAFSGVLNIDNTAEALLLLERSLPISIRRTGSAIIVSAR